MLDLSLTRIRHSKDLPVVAGSVVTEEGIPLVQVMIDGTEYVAAANDDAAADATQFVGFSYAETMRPSTKAFYTEFTPTATCLKVQIVQSPDATQCLVKDNEGTTYAKAAAPASGKYAIVEEADGTKWMEFDASAAGKKIKIQFRYIPTKLELQFNDRVPFTFSTAPELYGRIGVILAGEVYTDMYDASYDWTAAPATGARLAIGSTGVVTMSDEGVAVNGYVIKTPDINNPYLGIRLG